MREVSRFEAVIKDGLILYMKELRRIGTDFYRTRHLSLAALAMIR